MLFRVFGIGCQLKILYPIVMFYSINMVYNFILLKKSSKMFFHNKSVLKHVVSSHSMWMVGRVYSHVTTRSFVSSTSPSSIVDSMSYTFLRAEITSLYRSEPRLPTNYTNTFNFFVAKLFVTSSLVSKFFCPGNWV